MRLRRLLQDDRVTADDFKRACKRLLENREALVHILESGSLKIGFTNRVATAGDGCIEIAWDFEL